MTSHQASADAVVIRPQRPEDAVAVVDVHLRSWRWAYTGLIPATYIDRLWSDRAGRVERLRAAIELATPDQRFWLVKAGGAVIGLAITATSRDPDATSDTGEVEALYLVPEAAGRGVGRRLLEHAVSDLRDRGYPRATLWVLDTNARARRFYEAAGWSPDGQSKVEERPGANLNEIRYAIDLRSGEHS